MLKELKVLNHQVLKSSHIWIKSVTFFIAFWGEGQLKDIPGKRLSLYSGSWCISLHKVCQSIGKTACIVYLTGLKAESQAWKISSETSFGSSQSQPHLQGHPRHQEWDIWGERSFEVQTRKTDCNDNEAYEGPEEPNLSEHFKTKCKRADR